MLVYLIEKLDNVSLKLHEPIDKGPVLKLDNTWEVLFSVYYTVIKYDYLFRLTLKKLFILKIRQNDLYYFFILLTKVSHIGKC